MTMTDGVINPAAADGEEMFIGWAPAPTVDRRFLLAAAPLGLLATGGVSWAVASALDDPGAGEWLTNATHEVSGLLLREPYLMIRTRDASAPAGIRTVLVVAQGKCTTGLATGAVAGRFATAAGHLIQRKGRQMLEVPPLAEKWLTPFDSAPQLDLVTPASEHLGRVRLRGSIMDSKCFFGVMRPGRGKTHKACASLCIRGGIPPSFWVRDGRGGEAVLLMTTADGAAMPMDILPLVADPVEVEGDIIRVGDILHLRADPDAYRRL